MFYSFTPKPSHGNAYRSHLLMINRIAVETFLRYYSPRPVYLLQLDFLLLCNVTSYSYFNVRFSSSLNIHNMTFPEFVILPSQQLFMVSFSNKLYGAEQIDAIRNEFNCTYRQIRESSLNHICYGITYLQSQPHNNNHKTTKEHSEKWEKYFCLEMFFFYKIFCSKVLMQNPTVASAVFCDCMFFE